MAGARIGVIFHGIGTPGRTLEPGEAPYWVDTARFETILDQIMALPDPARIRISFDDGNLSDHDIALPRLQARGLGADVFMLSGRIGQAGSLGVPQILALQAAGFTIGSHGVAHRDWRRLGAADLEAELAGSRAALEAVCGGPVTMASIPFGSYNARVLKAVRAAGYVCAWSSDRGRMNPNAFLRPRSSVRADASDADLAAILSGRMGPGQAARRLVGMTRRRLFAG